MNLKPTPIPGVFVIEPERHADERGFFARLWSPDALSAHGLNASLAQISLSYNERRGTLRGLHYQAPPMQETKIVRCTRGAIFDVAVDLRPESPTFRRWTAHELTESNRSMLYIPEGCAHGFQTLADGCEVLYFISCAYSPSHGRGVRWDDPAFGIEWPAGDRIMNARDRTYPDFIG
jgi:dTDP-4-dehydrorhamnose 3,5-epimerase